MGKSALINRLFRAPVVKARLATFSALCFRPRQRLAPPTEEPAAHARPPSGDAARPPRPPARRRRRRPGARSASRRSSSRRASASPTALGSSSRRPASRSGCSCSAVRAGRLPPPLSVASPACKPAPEGRVWGRWRRCPPRVRRQLPDRAGEGALWRRPLPRRDRSPPPSRGAAPSLLPPSPPAAPRTRSLPSLPPGGQPRKHTVGSACGAAHRWRTG